MTRYRQCQRTKANTPFDGKKSVKYDKGYFYYKIEFAVEGNTLSADFTLIGSRKPSCSIKFLNFRDKTATEIFSENPNLGKHFEDGILEIYKYFNLDFGFTEKILRNL